MLLTVLSRGSDAPRSMFLMAISETIARPLSLLPEEADQPSRALPNGSSNTAATATSESQSHSRLDLVSTSISTSVGLRSRRPTRTSQCAPKGRTKGDADRRRWPAAWPEPDGYEASNNSRF